MNKARLLPAVLLLIGAIGFSAPASAQPAPPPPPPPAPEGGPVYAPAPPPTAAPAPMPMPARCGVYPAAPCYRPVRYHMPRFWRLGPYIGFGGGGFGILGAKGPYESLSSGGFGNLYIGMNFSPRFALELGFIGSAHNEEWTGEPNSLMMWGVTLDAKFNLVRPSWRHRFVPYLQFGAGAYGLFSDSYYGSQDLAEGGGFQAGGGIDIYLTRWLTLGARVLYRGIILGKLNTTCDGQCISQAEEDRTYINGLTGEINLGIVF